MDSMLLVSLLRSFVHDAGTDWLQPSISGSPGQGWLAPRPSLYSVEGGGMALTTQRKVL